MKKQTIDEGLIDKIDHALLMESRPISIREIKTKLKKVYDIERSPQLVLKYLNVLQSRKKAKEI